MDPVTVIGEDRAVVVIRAAVIDDPVALVSALVEGGIRAIEFTFTTEGVLEHIRRAIAADTGAAIGAGTVTIADQARAARDAGATFLVTPAVLPDVAAEGLAMRVPVLLGAFTPTEVMKAMELGVSAVKVFPAVTAGTDHFSQLLGPLPGVRLIASGGIDANNAARFLRSGAFAVTAGSSVVPVAAIEAHDWAGITAGARAFVAALGAES
ncbi:MAG TPA: bifunctional 4-hydroxy-2-oxoglutarate aldolase/2-dehydro-3-deoxy-phosphogluconate aldolase [Galbitalea sp.]|jgi:2-dehydro-3-deoxyphosphogluconate aldolase/(4S)-4-hydroxy-2-oxoglutarate aldolase|nr:bifunctional 4-hydroxy-2-oxoglutarate aldolase/2-dehydro-3-deoxy-phosphogluconate aldolase [Galbitalea sp.]